MLYCNVTSPKYRGGNWWKRWKHDHYVGHEDVEERALKDPYTRSYLKRFGLLPNDEILTFGDDESAQLMSLEEIRLMRELGEVIIDDTHYSIEDTSLHIVDKAGGCQRMIVLGLKRKN